MKARPLFADLLSSFRDAVDVLETSGLSLDVYYYHLQMIRSLSNQIDVVLHNAGIPPLETFPVAPASNTGVTGGLSEND